MAAATAQKSDRKLLTDSKLNKQLAQLQHLRQLSFTKDAEKGDSCRSSLMASGKVSTSGDQVAAEEALITHNQSRHHFQSARPRGLIKKLGSLLSYPRKLSKVQSSKGSGTDSKYSKVQKGSAVHDQNISQVEAVRSSSDRHFSGGAALSEGVGGGNSFGSMSQIILSSSGSRPGSMGHLQLAHTSSSQHVRRNSLSRVLQQVGGKVFCGSGHMMEELELKGLAPLRREGSGSACNASTVYFEPEELEEDAEMDEAYWQSLAQAILSRRGGRMTGPSSSGYDLSDNASILSSTPVERGAVTSAIAEEVEEEEEEGQEQECAVTSTQVAAEIVPDGSSQQRSISKYSSVSVPSTSTGIGRSFDSSIYKGKLIRVGGESTRLNTTLDESPYLLHNQHLLQRSVANSSPSPTPSTTGATTSTSPQPTRTRSRSSDVLDIGCVPSTSSSSTHTDQHQCTNHNRSNIQPLERFLWQARLSSSPPRQESEASQQPPSGGHTTGLRTSLMALLHEEKEESAAEYEQLAVALALEQSTAEAEAEAEAGDGRAAVAQEAEQQESEEWCSKLNTLVGEDPLLCCVCMVGRKGAALIPCGHTFCRSCTKQLFAGRGACPLCNNLIVQVLDIF